MNEMTPVQALGVLCQAAYAFTGNHEQHVLIEQAAAVLRDLVGPAASENGQAKVPATTRSKT